MVSRHHDRLGPSEIAELAHEFVVLLSMTSAGLIEEITGDDDSIHGVETGERAPQVLAPPARLQGPQMKVTEMQQPTVTPAGCHCLELRGLPSRV